MENYKSVISENKASPFASVSTPKLIPDARSIDTSTNTPASVPTTTSAYKVKKILMISTTYKSVSTSVSLLKMTAVINILHAVIFW